jgi:peptidyl-prolyl cis-trans isomerase A (cyclophilin A)
MLSRSWLRFLPALFLAAAAHAQQPAAKPPVREPGLYATIQTSMGNITLRLFEKESPITVKNFTDLALGLKEYTDPRTHVKSRKPLYNGLTFHRIVPDFMIQGGDPLGTGNGGTEPIKDEFAPSLKFDVPGRLGMANAGYGTGSCQFFITVAPAPHINGRHTIFGQVTQGMDIVKRIAAVPLLGEKPKTPVRILRVSVTREGAAAAKPAVKPIVRQSK